MKKFLFGFLLGGFLVFGYFFVKLNPHNIYVISAKVWIDQNFPYLLKEFESTDPVGLANPASLHCEEQAGTPTITETGSGQVGVCVFADGSSCEEWQFFRGECSPGTGLTKDPLFPGDKNTTGDLVYPNESLEENANEGNKNNGELTACTMEYMPVCAEVQVECIKAPCPPIKQTFGNKCTMNANKRATFLYEGECLSE